MAIKIWNPTTDTYEQLGENRLVPLGGDEGQLLAKASSADYDTEWVAPPLGEVLFLYQNYR